MCFLPKCCALTWWGGLCDLMTLEAKPVGTLVLGPRWVQPCWAGLRWRARRIGPLQLAIHMVQNAPCWREKLALGQDKQSKLPFKIMYVFCLSFPSATFALQQDGFVPREWPAAKGLLQRLAFQVGGWAMAQCPIPVKKYHNWSQTRFSR